MNPRRLLLLLAVFAIPLAAGPARAATPVDLHSLTWHVHVDLTDQGAGSQPLSYYEDLIAEATATATALVKGDDGPFEGPCCAEFSTVSVSLFGTSGDGLDVPSSAADFAALDAVAGFAGSHVFFVDSLGWCGAPTTTAIGCGDQPGCSGDPNDDPFLVSVVTLEAHEVYDVLGNTLAHERGHNACLGHVAANGCQLMQSNTGGGCLDASECSNYQAGRTGAGGTCECHLDASNLEPNGAACSEGAVSGACSGGLCLALPSEASSQLLVAGGTELLVGATPDDALLMSGATGGYVDAGPIGSGAEPRGLAYDPDRNVVFAVTPTAGDDELLILDPATGALLGSVGSLSGIQDVIALAFDPGATPDPADDRLFALDDDASAFEDLLEIDPATAAVVNRGGLNSGFTSGFTGLAFDAETDTLYASSAGNLFTIDHTSCPPGLCNTSPVGGVSLPRTDSGLAWSANSGLLHLVGNQFGGARTLYDTVDPTTGAVGETRIIDGFTVGGVAAPPAAIPACRDGLDNDGDGEADHPSDVGCYEPDSAIERPQCQDGLDNDGQIGTDFDGGESVLGVGNGDPDGADPQCVGKPFRNKESNASSCGMGVELALLLPVLLGVRRRRR